MFHFHYRFYFFSARKLHRPRTHHFVRRLVNWNHLVGVCLGAIPVHGELIGPRVDNAYLQEQGRFSHLEIPPCVKITQKRHQPPQLGDEPEGFRRKHAQLPGTSVLTLTCTTTSGPAD
jgi:hypothetical protein